MISRKVDYQKVVGYVLLCVGIMLTIWVCWVLLLSVNTYQWEKTTALVYESSLRATTTNPTDKSEAFYTVDIEYRYRVKNILYRATRIYRSNLPMMNYQKALETTQQFSVGSVTEVYYNPLEPNEAVLTRGISLNILMILAPALLFVIFGFRVRR